MPLTTCPDCEKKISDTAPACPGCGRPMLARVPGKPGITPKNVQTIERTGKEIKLLRLGSGLVVCLGVLFLVSESFKIGGALFGLGLGGMVVAGLKNWWRYE